MKIIYCHNGFDKVYQTIIKMKHNAEMVGKICIDMKLAIDIFRYVQSFFIFTDFTNIKIHSWLWDKSSLLRIIVYSVM